jgi:anti-anti-sigma regulatory factor
MTYTPPERVSIRNIKQVHAELLDCVNKRDEVEIDLENSIEIDLSLIQLIEAARKTAETSGKSISLTRPANDTVRAALERAGLFDSFTSDDTKFWLHKEKR